MLNTLENIIKVFTLIIPLLVAVAYFTLAERKVLGSMQIREGPNTVGIKGIIQPIADGIKLFSKERIIPTKANKVIYKLAATLALMLALIIWGVIPYEEGNVISDINLGILYILMISSISVYAILTSGWSSNSKYAFIGAIRAAAQMISYEVTIGLIIIQVIICAGSMNLTEIVLAQKEIWFIIPLFPSAIMFFISALAETNRAPFDLTEGESELVSGYNVEYTGMTFALFFLAEYANILLMSAMATIFFFGGCLPIQYLEWIPGYITLGIKIITISFIFIWVRATFPRIRYDQLMQLIWKSYLPFCIGNVIFIASIYAI